MLSMLQAKKVASHLKKHSGGHGYTDQDNPFGDSNVTERFVWGKKLEKQIQSGVDVKDLTARAEKRRQEERLVLLLPLFALLRPQIVHAISGNKAYTASQSISFKTHTHFCAPCIACADGISLCFDVKGHPTCHTANGGDDNNDIHRNAC